MPNDSAGELRADCSSCPVRSLVVYRNVVERDPAAVQNQRVRIRRLPARSAVLAQDETTDEFASLYSGWAVRYHVLGDGGRQILGVLLPGDPVCLPMLSLGRAPYAVEAVTEVQLCVFRREDFIDYMRREPDQCLDFLGAFGRDLLRTEASIIDMGRRSASARLARFVLDLYGRLARRGAVTEGRMPFPLRRHHLADALGISTVHVHRLLTELRSLGVLIVERDSLEVRDLRELVRIAGHVPEEYRADIGV